MLDYWISFATTLEPNDGKGTSSEAQNSIPNKTSLILTTTQDLSGLSIPSIARYVLTPLSSYVPLLLSAVHIPGTDGVE